MCSRTSKSSVASFRLTIDRIKKLIDDTIDSIQSYQSGDCVLNLTEISGAEDFDYDDQNTDFFSVGKKVKYAMKTDMVPQNVAMKVDRPRKNSFQPTFLDAEQMQKLFEVVKGTRLELPVLVAAFYQHLGRDVLLPGSGTCDLYLRQVYLCRS